MEVTSFLTISYLNVRGQTGLNVEKQLQIERFLKETKTDILHLQETDVDDNTFQECKYISSNFYIVVNNALNKYGTATLIRNNLEAENVSLDTDGRIVIFQISGLTFGNLYLPSGTDAESKISRENYFGKIIPNMLVNCMSTGCIGGDLNCIIDKKDATNNPETKISSCLRRLVKIFNWSDSFRILYPQMKAFSRYYEVRGDLRASRIDRQYQWGDIEIIAADHFPVAFSDHFALVTRIKVPAQITKLLCPKARPMFKIKEEVARDQKFQDRVKISMSEWENVRKHGLPITQWWEYIVKPGIRKIGLERCKEINSDRQSTLNLLLLRQSYLINKIKRNLQAQTSFAELSIIQASIQDWYRVATDKIKQQCRIDEFQTSEQVRIYHHEIHQKKIKRSAILKLQTEEGLLEGHNDCAKFLERQVENLLLTPAILCSESQSSLLNELEPVVTLEENNLLAIPPTKNEIYEVIKDSNQNAAPGLDGIPISVYSACWDFLGDPLSELAMAIFQGEKLPQSMRTSMMVFGCKPKKVKSINPKDKRRISLLNCDFKIIEGIEAKRFRRLGNRILSPLQYVAGDNRKIHHGIARARDAVNVAMKNKYGCGIADMDFVAAFDWLVLNWVWKVLERVGVNSVTINRLKNLYADCITVVVVNNKPGQMILDLRGSLRQGGLASMEWFAFGIDPLLRFLDKRLEGIPIVSLPLFGPCMKDEQWPLSPLQERFKLMAYCDDLKPSITCMSEFITVDKACQLFELSSGCRLHRDPSAGKCKFLALGRWRGLLEQEDLPLSYMVLSDSLEMVGVELRATWAKTRQANGEVLQDKVSVTINAWKSGKFMDLTSRPWSLNCYALSKIWHRCHTVDLRLLDISKISSKIKSWLFQDQFEKPEEFVLYRSIIMGGLGLHNVKIRSKALLIRNFLETAVHPSYLHSLLHSLIYRAYVLNDDSIDSPPVLPPFLTQDILSLIKEAKENTPLNVTTMTTAQWYMFLLEKEIMELSDEGTLELIKTRTERASLQTDWETSWRRARLRGLGSEAMSFLWKLLHNLLPTEARLARMLKNTSETCKLCPAQRVADLTHCMFECISSQDVGNWLLSLFKSVDSTVNATRLVKLDFMAERSEEMPLVWILAHTLLHVWTIRKTGKSSNIITTRAILERKFLCYEKQDMKMCVPK